MFVNLTPHDIHVVDANNQVVKSIEKSGNQARCAVMSSDAGEFDGVQLTVATFGQVSGLPDPQDGVMYIVSLLVRQAVPTRKDVVSPGEMVRDANGVIIGCKNFSVNG